MNEMIERAALAIRETLIAKGVDAANPFGEMISEHCARSAIAAMREPTGPMMGAGADVLSIALDNGGSYGLSEEQAAEVFAAMIDAALAE